MFQDALKSLKKILPAQISTEADTLFKYSFDGMKMSFLPSAVIKITEENQVGEVLKIANQHKVPVTTRGAGSSLTGSAAAIKDGWVLDLTALNTITIDPQERYAHVGAGAITGDINRAAKKANLFYPPDPSSANFCTIGGNIACNAGGLRCVKYGVTRDYVVALTGFLANGEKVHWGLPLKKYAAGYNIRDLWIGSEGTLGVVTSAILKLIPVPQSHWTLLLAFKDDQAALNAAENFSSKGVTPSVFEFMDTLTVSGVEKQQGTGPIIKGMPGASLLLLELDGDKSGMEKDRALVLEWAKECADEYIEAHSVQDAEALWAARREGSSAMFQHGTAKLNEDVVVPLNKLGQLVFFVKELSSKTGLKMPIFGHAGDGNLHVNIMYEKESAEQTDLAQRSVKDLMEKVVALGGAITGEHGIGLAKSSFLHLQHAEVEVATMKAIKAALDPNNILNPGKIFTVFKPWEHKAVDYKLPWDHY